LFTFLKRKNDPHLPDFVKRYQESCEQIDKKSSLNDLKFICFDTESTSLDPTTAKLLSLGAVTIQNNRIDIKNNLDYYVRWNNKEKPQNVEIHGITNRQSQKGVKPEDAIQLFLEYIQGAVLVAHNVSFDVSMFNNILKKYYGSIKLTNPVLDTARLAIRLEVPQLDSNNYNAIDYTLDALFDRYRITPLERHSALGDAYGTGLLFMKLLSRLEKRGVSKLHQL